MEYQFSNYFANPEDLNALAHHLPEGSVLIMQEDSSLTVESFDQSGIEFSGGSYTSNYPIDNVDVTTNGSDFCDPVNNSLNGVGFTGAGMEYSASRALSRTLAYTNTNTVVKANKVMFKIPAGSVYVSTKLVSGATKILRVGGGVAGGVGVFMTGVEIYTGQKDFIGEGGLDLIMGGVAFIPGGGRIISGVYFGGKLLLESTGNDFWNE